MVVHYKLLEKAMNSKKPHIVLKAIDVLCDNPGISKPFMKTLEKFAYHHENLDVQMCAMYSLIYLKYKIDEDKTNEKT